MAKTKTVRLSDEEFAALEAYRAGKTTVEGSPDGKVSDAHRQLADAFVEAIERTKPPVKKTVANRKENTPWTPADGAPKLKMKRQFHHHGMRISDNVSNEEIALLNQLKPGSFCDGFVRVTLRKDKGIDIDHPIRTAAQRLKLVNSYGIRSFAELLQRCIDEKQNPRKYRTADDMDLFDLE